MVEFVVLVVLFVEFVIFGFVVVFVELDGVGLLVILTRVTLSIQGPIQAYRNLFPRLKTESKQITLLVAVAVKIFEPEATPNSPTSVKLYNHWSLSLTITVEDHIVHPFTEEKLN